MDVIFYQMFVQTYVFLGNDDYTLSAIQGYLPEPQQNKHSLFAELQSGDSSAVDLENKKLDSSDHVPSRVAS